MIPCGSAHGDTFLGNKICALALLRLKHTDFNAKIALVFLLLLGGIFFFNRHLDLWFLLMEWQELLYMN